MAFGFFLVATLRRVWWWPRQAHDADNDRVLVYLDTGKLLGVALSGPAKDEPPTELASFRKSEHYFNGPMYWFENEWWVVDRRYVSSKRAKEKHLTTGD